MAVERVDPYIAFTYILEIDAIRGVAGFNEVTGLDAEVEPVEYRNGDEVALTARKLKGLTKYPNIVLKRGILGSLDLFDWVKQGIEGNQARSDGAIILQDELQNEVFRWKFTRGWACKYTGPSLKGDSSAVAIESVEICHEELRAL